LLIRQETWYAVKLLPGKALTKKAPKLAVMFRHFAIFPYGVTAAILMEVAFGTNMAAMTRHDVT